jgi:predicted nucleic acid-binding protein
MANLAALPITVDADSGGHVLGDVHRLAILYGLTSYDAAYLELAVRRDLPIATLDAELIKACQAAGITVL